MPDIEKIISSLVDRDACPLCESREHTVHLPFRNIPVHRCRECRFLFSGKVMPPEALASYYEDNFGSERHRRGQIVNSQVNAAALPTLIDLKQVKHILDVGAGYGYLVKLLKDRYDLEVCGVEPSVQEAEFARKRLQLDVRNGVLVDAGYAPASFEVAMCFEVIEHIERPIEFIRKMRHFVKPGGWVVIMTDNFESEVVQRMGPMWPKWIPHTHVSHFGPQSLEDCITLAGGLEIEGRLSYTPWENRVAATMANLRPPVPTEEAYDLEATLASEMGGRYRFYALRKALNRSWFALSRRRNLDGALMYIATRVV